MNMNFNNESQKKEPLTNHIQLRKWMESPKPCKSDRGDAKTGYSRRIGSGSGQIARFKMIRVTPEAGQIVTSQILHKIRIKISSIQNKEILIPVQG